MLDTSRPLVKVLGGCPEESGEGGAPGAVWEEHPPERSRGVWDKVQMGLGFSGQGASRLG